MKTYIGIDPGPDTSGVVFFQDGRVVSSDKAMPNSEVLKTVRAPSRPAVIGCEAIECLYAHVGKETVRTIRFVGRIEEAVWWWGTTIFGSPQDIKKEICGSASAKDPAVRQALIDILGAPGTKKNPGPTFGVSSHAWRALAVAVYTLRKDPTPDGEDTVPPASCAP